MRVQKGGVRRPMYDRDRPGGPRSHPGFRFRRQRAGWMLHMRGFPTRLPDWLAVHEATGTTRRFVEVNESHVWDELEGFRKAPDQEKLDERWGNPEPRAASIGP